eukprot:m.47495 g.47495  ORF g.47495 m.47495 type:complete len:192 (-) comp17662_c0_seq1:115-690(-)
MAQKTIPIVRQGKKSAVCVTPTATAGTETFDFFVFCVSLPHFPFTNNHTPDHTTPPTMATFDNIAAAINAIRKPHSAKGASRAAIKAYIGDASTTARINLALRRGVDNGKLLKIGDSFKLTKAAAPAPKKKTTTKKTTTKKTTKKTPKKTTKKTVKKTVKKTPKKKTTKKTTKKTPKKKTTKKTTKKTSKK